jgi:hypothetical protein
MAGRRRWHPARLVADTEFGRPGSARLVAAGLACVASLAVLLIASRTFRYHSLNHDEGVYLQQAAALLEGRLGLEPPVPEAFRPWFFVADGTGGFYPKYAPVPAVMFAVGGLVGEFRLALAAIAAATVALAYAAVAEAFDRRVGLVAAALVLGSPLFLVQASVFLPYVPTLCLNLLFAWAYLRSDRTGSARWAALAGAAVGLAFFARPWTAVLFAAPFVAHALWRLRSVGRSVASSLGARLRGLGDRLRSRDSSLDRPPDPSPDRPCNRRRVDSLFSPVLRRNLVTAALGLCGVAAALGYNHLVTGDPLTFPYEAFAPADGLGFGRRALLGYELEYTLDLAVRAGLANVGAFLTDWVVAGPVGGLLAAVGVARAVSRRRAHLDSRRLAVAGLFLTIPVGELYFWGTLNVLGDLDRAGDGLLASLGPYYHVGLLVPTAAFAGFALVGGGAALRRLLARSDDGTRRGLLLAAVLLGSLAGTGAGAAAVADPLADNGEVADVYEEAYEPFADRSLSGVVVFVPRPYGDWLNHPFQRLRNDPGYDGETVYALENRPFAVADAYPDRRLYRYAYRGEWSPATGERVTPVLRPVDRAAGDRVNLEISAGVPTYTELVSLRVASDEGTGYATVTDPAEGVDLEVTVDAATATVSGPGLDDTVTVPVGDREDVRLRLLADFGGVDTLPYRIELPVDRDDGRRRALSPRLEVCDEARRCNGEAAYVPGASRDGVSLNATLRGAGSG